MEDNKTYEERFQENRDNLNNALIKSKDSFSQLMILSKALVESLMAIDMRLAEIASSKTKGN